MTKPLVEWTMADLNELVAQLEDLTLQATDAQALLEGLPEDVSMKDSALAMLDWVRPAQRICDLLDPLVEASEAYKKAQALGLVPAPQEGVLTPEVEAKVAAAKKVVTDVVWTALVLNQRLIKHNSKRQLRGALHSVISNDVLKRLKALADGEEDADIAFEGA